MDPSLDTAFLHKFLEIEFNCRLKLQELHLKRNFDDGSAFDAFRFQMNSDGDVYLSTLEFAENFVCNFVGLFTEDFVEDFHSSPPRSVGNSSAA